MLQLLSFVIDCPDLMRSGGFLLRGGRPRPDEGSSDVSAGLAFGEVGLTFKQVENDRPPRWPDDEHPKRHHLDFEVDLIEPEGRRVVELGATLVGDFIGPAGYGWQVYTDPAGHPFCLCRHDAGVTWTDERVM